MRFIIFILSSFVLSFAEAKIRLGWQIPWAIQGQLIQSLKHSDILKKNNLNIEFIGKTFGPELNELALANEVDIILTADQPALTLMAKSEKWLGVSRLMYNRTSTYVPLNSNIKSIADLKNKKIGLPIGAAAQRILIDELTSKKINSDTEVTFINLGIQEHIPLIKKASLATKSWDQFDALSGFDPIPAIIEKNNLAKIIHNGKVCSLIVVNRDFLKKNKTEVQAFVRAIAEAYDFYRDNPNIVNKYFIDEAQLKNIDDETLKLTTLFEPNLITNNNISLTFTDDDFKILNSAAIFVEKITNKKIDPKKYISNDFIK